MNKNTKQHITDIMAPAGNETVEQFLTLLELPDEQFKLIYPDLKKKLMETFKSTSIQNSLIEQIKYIDLSTAEEEQAAAEELIKEIKADDTLIPEKIDVLTSIINEAIIAVYKIVAVPRQRIGVKIKRLNPEAKIPEYAHKTDAGADVYAIEDTTIKPHTTQIIKTGIAVAIPTGYEIQVRPRSGLSLKTPLRIANAPGTIKVA